MNFIDERLSGSSVLMHLSNTHSISSGIVTEESENLFISLVKRHRSTHEVNDRSRTTTAKSLDLFHDDVAISIKGFTIYDKGVNITLVRKHQGLNRITL